MGRYTSIRSEIWTDGEVENLNVIGKALYLYLLTSPLSNAAGYYRIPVKQIALDLNLEEKEILPELRSQQKLWKYDEKTKQVLIPNYLKYNKLGGPNQLRGLNIQLSTLEKCDLHIEFIYSVHKYLGDAALEKLDKEFLKYVLTKCKELDGKEAKATVLVNILNNINI